MAEVRPIDANRLLECLRNAKKEFEDQGNALLALSTHFVFRVLETEGVMPTIDYAPVRHGEWMIHCYNSEKYEYEDIPYNPLSFDNPSGTLFCSACDAEALLNAHEEDVPSKYCPNCGAKMDGGAKDD